MEKTIISIEGNIGVGKSTFINILDKKWDDCAIVSEPVEIWKELKDKDNKNILQIFYEDIPRWGYTFQNLACITRMMKMEDAINSSNNKYIFLDRSLATDKNVFEKMLYNDGLINDIEHNMYNYWCDFYFKYVRKQNNIIHIYLQCDPEICFNRIQKRGRVEESGISIDYLRNLNKYHDEWLLNSENVIIINCDEDFELNDEKQEEMINCIKYKLEIINNNKNINNEKISNNNKIFEFDEEKFNIEKFI